MSAEVLRQAAKLMRERAEVWEYHAGTWRTEPGPAGWSVVRCTGPIEADEFGPGGEHDTFVLQMDTPSTAEHIASWHPAVALAVADWLERVADQHDTLMGAMESGMSNLTEVAIASQTNEKSALAVAHAYLGSDQ